MLRTKWSELVQSDHCSVLVVDESEQDYLIIKEMLEESIFDFKTAWKPTIEDALHIMEHGTVHVCLLNHLIKQIPELSDTPVIATSPFDDTEADFAAMEAGADYFISKKELTHANLERSIRYVLQKKKAQNTLRRLADEDSVTGLVNHRAFKRILQKAMRRSDRFQKKLAVLFIDLNEFKQVNDTLGHAFGDSLLKTVSERIKGCIRATDTAGRIGGDEFAVILEGLEEQKNALSVASKIIEAVRYPVRIEDESARVGCSIGISTYERLDTLEDVLRRADKNMYTAKRKGCPVSLCAICSRGVYKECGGCKG